MKRRFPILLLLIIFIFPIFACNLPVTPIRVDAGSHARETLAARLFAPRTALPGSGPQDSGPQDSGPQEEPQGGLAQETAQPGAAGEAPTGTPIPMSLFTPPPEMQVTLTPGVPVSDLEGDTFHYVTQPGDTADALALRFGVKVEQVLDPALYPRNRYLPAGLLLSIPNTLGNIQLTGPLLPDSEVVYSPAAQDLSLSDFVRQAGGFLSSYTEPVDSVTLTGAQIIQRVADETSINPRLLLAFLEYRSHWVFGSPEDPRDTRFPVGFGAGDYTGLYKEITLVARQLTVGYYGWRSGKVTGLTFIDQTHARINPAVNAGTAALQYLFAVLYTPSEWHNELYGEGRFFQMYRDRFGDPWRRAVSVGALLPDALEQIPLQLPFPAGERWVLTGGPHAAWGIGSPWGGVDFAPSAVEPGCTVSHYWVTAAAPGVVVRSENGQVVEDLDGDGRAETGWALLYLHVAAKDRVPTGTRLSADDPIGHPSCEGGKATGSHVHIARKYNGEWIAADGAIPFVLSGWQAVNGALQYQGKLVKGDQVVLAQPDGSHTALIVR